MMARKAKLSAAIFLNLCAVIGAGYLGYIWIVNIPDRATVQSLESYQSYLKNRISSLERQLEAAQRCSNKKGNRKCK